MRTLKISSIVDTFSKVLLANISRYKCPLSVTYIVTYKCNLRCKYCSVWRDDEPEMGTDQALSMIDQFAKMGTKRVSFNGGEALLRDDLGTMIEHCAEMGLITSLFSNGSLVKSKINSLKRLNLLMVSLDGPPEVHNDKRGTNSYEGAIEAIKAAKDAGLCVWTNTVLTADNLQYIDFILEKAEELGARTIFQPVLYYPHSASEEVIKGLSSSPGAYEKAINKLIERKQAGAPIVHSVSYFKYITKPSWKLRPRRCWAAKLYCAVTPSGRVAPCYPIYKQQDWPNGLKMGFEKAFASIPNFSCQGCWCFTVESDFFYSFNPEVMYNYYKEFHNSNGMFKN